MRKKVYFNQPKFLKNKDYRLTWILEIFNSTGFLIFTRWVCCCWLTPMRKESGWMCAIIERCWEPQSLFLWSALINFRRASKQCCHRWVYKLLLETKVWCTVLLILCSNLIVWIWLLSNLIVISIYLGPIRNELCNGDCHFVYRWPLSSWLSLQTAWSTESERSVPEGRQLSVRLCLESLLRPGFFLVFVHLIRQSGFLFPLQALGTIPPGTPVSDLISYGLFKRSCWVVQLICSYLRIITVFLIQMVFITISCLVSITYKIYTIRLFDWCCSLLQTPQLGYYIDYWTYFLFQSTH